MAYARLEEPIKGEWIERPRYSGARFTRIAAGQRWVLHVKPAEWVTQAQAATLLGVSLVRVNGWVRAARIPAGELAGVSVIPLPVVRSIYLRRKRLGPVGPGDHA